MAEVVSKNFENVKVYCIRNFVNNEIYVGSSCQPLSKRMAKHRSSMNATAKKDRRLYQEMRTLGAEQFYIELLEEVKCENIEQLRKIEGEYIRQMGTLNALVNGRTKEELVQTEEYKERKKETDRQYYLNNKERINQQNKQYRDEHTEEIREWKKNNYENNRDEILKKQKEYHQANKEARNEKNRIYREQHKEEINKKNAVKHICECGMTYTQNNKARHCKSQKHQNFINNQ